VQGIDTGCKELEFDSRASEGAALETKRLEFASIWMQNTAVGLNA
jgi:hypothetical protein